MNLAQTKAALESKVIEFLKNSLSEEVQVLSYYNANNGIMNVSLQEVRPVDEAREEKLIYSVSYEENTDDITITAISRLTVKDDYGVSIVTHNGIPVALSFINNLKQIIVTAMDVVYNPEKYQDTGANVE